MVETVTAAEYKKGLKNAVAEYEGLLEHMQPTGGAARAISDLLALCRESGPLHCVRDVISITPPEFPLPNLPDSHAR